MHEYQIIYDYNLRVIEIMRSMPSPWSCELCKPDCIKLLLQVHELQVYKVELYISKSDLWCQLWSYDSSHMFHYLDMALSMDKSNE